MEVQGVPPPSIQWYRGNNEISENDPKLLVSDMDEYGVATLILNDIRAEDGGEIKCVAANQVGITTTAALLTVEGSYSMCRHHFVDYKIVKLLT